MNRAERRRLEKQGKVVPKEPTLQLKTSDFNAMVNRARDDAKKIATDAAIHEINRQILERDEAFSLDLDSMVLWTLHRHLGFGKKRLESFYRAMVEEHIAMREYYQMDDTYPERYNLLRIGVDVEALNKEMIEKFPPPPR